MVSRTTALALVATLAATVLVIGLRAGCGQPDVGPVAQLVSLEPAVSPPIAALLARGDSLRSEQRFEEALKAYEEALEQTGESSAGRAWALIGQGRVAKSRSEIYHALALVQQALEIFRAVGDRRGESIALHNLGACFTAVGEQTLARDRYEEALDRRTNDAEMAITLSHLATLDDLAGQHEAAIQGFRDALALRLSNLAETESARLHGKAAILDRLGTAAMFARQPTVARRAYSSARELFRRLDRRRDLAVTTGNLGWLEIDGCAEGRTPCDPIAAIGEFDGALAGIDAANHPELEAIFLTGKARALRHAGRLAAAEATARQGLDRVEALRARELQPLLRTSFLARHHPLYDELITLLVERHRLEPGAGHDFRALQVAELARARSLLERTVDVAADEAPVADGRQGELATLRLRLNDLERQRLEKIDQLACLTAVAPEHLAARIEEIADLERELRQTLLASEAEGRGLRNASLDAAPWLTDPADLQKRVDDRTVLLIFALGQEASFLWWIDPRSAEVFVLPGRGWLEPRVRDVQRAMAESGQMRSDARQRAVEAAERELSRSLLGPIAGRLEDQRLVLLPDGVLHTLPFAALPDPADGEPLIEHHQIAYLPSIALWDALSRRAAERAGNPAMSERRLLTVFADAVYTTNDPRLADAVAEDADGCSSLSALPATAEEAEHLRRLVPAHRRQEYLSFQADRRAVLGGALSNSKIVHLAVHGELNEARPEFSHLVLSLYDVAGRRQDGRVFTHEIDDLRLDADLVVLSACDTGRGKVVQGEGVVGMTQALLAAGANRALVSLWSVEDGATAELMQGFYESLLAGHPPADALRRAQRTLRRKAHRRAPFYWAGFVLVGDWR